jgi:hypothetical protein
MTTYATLAYYFLIPSVAQFNEVSRNYVLLLIVVCTAVLPALSVVALVRLGNIDSLHIEERKQRNWPLLQTVFIYFIVFYLLKDKPVPSFIVYFLLGAIAAMLIALLINLKWKISLHGIGAGGLCGGLSVLYMQTGEGSIWILALSFILAGALGSARLQLRAHQPAEVAVGLISGFFIQFLILLLLLPRVD